MKKSKIASGRTVWGIHLFLVTLIPLLYWEVQTNGFVWDDGPYIAYNQFVKHGITIDSIKWAFTTNYLSNWHPVTWLSFMMDYSLFGKDPLGYHIVNVGLHIINSLLLFGLLRQITGCLWPSALVAVLLAAHPLHVESVAWISERKDVLSLLFGLLTIKAYLRYMVHPSLSKYLQVCFLFSMGLMTKPMLVTLPLLLLLLDYWPLQRVKSPQSFLNPGPNAVPPHYQTKKRSTVILIFEKVPLLLLSMALSIITIYSQSTGGAVVKNTPIWNRLSDVLLSYVQYAVKLVWPIPIAVIYPIREVHNVFLVTGAGLLLFIVTLFVFRKRIKFPFMVTGWLWYLISLLPVIGIIPIGQHSIADRYTYIPFIGLYVVVAWSLQYLVLNKKRFAGVVYLLTILFLLCMAMLTKKQVSIWKNNMTLFGHAVYTVESNWPAYTNYASALMDNGSPQDSIQFFNKALAINPNYYRTYYGRGLALAKLGDLHGALADFNVAIQLCATDSAPFLARGTIFNALNKYHLALADFGQTIALEPNNAFAHHYRGIAHWNMGKKSSALEDSANSIRLNPQYRDAYINRGAMLAELGEWSLVIDNYTNALNHDKLFFEAYVQRGLVYEKIGRIPEAVADYRNALHYMSQKSGARENIEKLLFDAEQKLADP